MLCERKVSEIRTKVLWNILKRSGYMDERECNLSVILK